MKLKIRGAIFDNDNTIAKIYPDPRTYWREVFLEIVKECGGRVPPGREDEFMLSYYTANGFEDKLAEIGLRTTFEEFQAGKGRVDERLRLKHIRAGNSRLFDDAVEFIRYLHERGIKYGVATFTSKPVVMAAIEMVPGLPPPAGFFGWDDSLKLGYEKPDSRIARTVLAQLGVEPSAAIMVGDRLTDVVMGNLAGMTTVLVKRREEDGEDLVGSLEREIEEIKRQCRFEDFDKIPNYQVARLTEIIPLLEQA